MEKPSSKPTPAPPPKHFLAKLANFFFLTVMNIVFMLISAFIIHQYDPNSTGRNPTPQLTISNRTFSLPPLIAQPTVPIVLFACIFYGSALSSFPNPPHDDPYQVHFLALGALAGFVAAKSDLGWEDQFALVLKSFVPLTVTGALVCSLVFHAVLRLVRGRPAAGEVGGGIGEKRD